MNRRDLLKALGLVAVSSAIPGCRGVVQKLSSAGKPNKKLNFVFILMDDMGWRDTGCYGSTFYETPNINRLASQGMKFTDAYAASPVCSPTRASILTGKYPARLNLTDWIGEHGPTHLCRELKPPNYIQQLPLEEVTIAEAFKAAGYATCFVGKWHLGKEPYYPEHQGFDINIGGWHAGGPWGGYFSPYANPKLKDGPKGQYLTDRLTDESLKFLDANRDKPFFLHLSHYAVHAPFQSKKGLIDKYKAKVANLPAPKGQRFLLDSDVKERQIQDDPVYSGMIQSADESVGRVMKKLEELGIADNTVVIFISDNGGMSTTKNAPTSNLPLRTGKGWLYEGGIREPLLIKCSGVIEPGSLCSEPVTTTDFYPTMLEMAGLPLRPKQHCDGVSLLTLLKKTGTLNRDAIYWHYPHYSGGLGGRPSGAVRAGDYKLIEFYEDNRVELYNLKKDISEKHDLVAKMPKKAAKLRKMLHNWREAVNAQMSTPGN